jgi:hypothetical protein
VIRTQFDPEALQDSEQRAWWTQWQQRAQAATDNVIDAFEEWLAGNREEPFRFEFNRDIWKDLKNWLIEHVFYDRCAYCERLISGFQGDAEHYRPKGGVRRRDTEGTLVASQCDIRNPGDGQALALGHPGYFWLAYDWRNLLPSCSFCNSGLGKNDRFDVKTEYVLLVALDPVEVESMDVGVRPRPSRRWPGYYYLSPRMLDNREAPLLLNPLNPTDDRNPYKHIRFGVRGIVTAVDDSPLGLNTIDVLRLKEEKLRQSRQKAQTEFQDKFFDKMRRYDPEAGQTDAEKLLAQYSQGREPFSAAVLDYYEGTLKKRYPTAPPR